MRCDIPTATAVLKKGKAPSDQYREKNAQLRTCSLLSLGNQIPLARVHVHSTAPAKTNASRHPPSSTNPRAKGTLTTEVSTPTLTMPPTACARLSGEMTSDRTPTAVGGRVPAASPANTRSPRNTSMLGANADAMTEAPITDSPARNTGRRPKESESGPRHNQGDRPGGEGRGGQLARDRHRYFQVRRDVHQERGKHENRVFSAKKGEGKHGEKPRLVHLSFALRSGLSGYAD